MHDLAAAQVTRDSDGASHDHDDRSVLVRGVSSILALPLASSDLRICEHRGQLGQPRAVRPPTVPVEPDYTSAEVA